MKSSRILALCLLSLSGGITTAQTFDSALALYPLNTGNRWEFHYRVGYCTDCYLYYYTLSINADTVMPNGKVYKVEVERRPSYSISRYLRIDSSGANLFRYLTQLPGGEVNVDSLRARTGDWFGCTCFPPLIVCKSVGPDTILGIPTLVKQFGVGVENNHTLAYGIGPVRFYEVTQDEFPAWSELVYARIDGHEFGTPASVREVEIGFPQAPALFQNYPNPFNPTTTIRYGLPSRSHVTVIVFNTLGQQIATLIDEHQDVGFHEVRFDAGDLASGVYFFRLTAGDFVSTMKMLMQK